MRMKPLPLVLAVALLSGCSLAPDYLRPQAQGVNEWQAEATASTEASAAQTGWRQVFTDPAMQKVISLALDTNTDLQLAALNVQRYQAQYRVQRADLLPSVNAGVSGSRSRQTTDAGKSYNEQYTASVGLTSYELDLFGRVRNLKDQALQAYLQQTEARRSTAITLVANVADAYLNWVSDRELLKLSRETLQIEEDNAELVGKRYELGVASELVNSQAQSSLEDARVNVARYERAVKLDRSALTLLVGQKIPDDLDPETELVNVHLAEIEPGMPSELINQRPDILAAEHALQGANANIGAAKAAFFPTVSLTASAGLASSDLDSLFTNNREMWSFSPSISLPIFNGGRLKAQLDTAKVDQKIAYVTYQQTIQNAFSEVTDALTNRDGYQKQLENQIRAEAAYQRYFDLADERYRTGVDDMLTRLDARSNLVTAQQSTITTRLSLLQAKVDLYRALGGGWLESTPLSEAKPTETAKDQPEVND